jgi:hypothetical protein
VRFWSVRRENEESQGCDFSGGTGRRWIRGLEVIPLPREGIRRRSPSRRFRCDVSPTVRTVTGAMISLLYYGKYIHKVMSFGDSPRDR